MAVAGTLVATAVLAGWQYALVRHPIRPALYWEPYRTVCSFGMRLSGAHLLDYVGSNLDSFILGRFASTAVLGQCSRAYSVIYQPLGNYAAQALTSVLFASLSRIQHELARLGRAYLSLLSLGGVVLFPVCAGVAVAELELVLVVLGPQWDLVAGMVPWFALAGGFSVLSKLSQSLAEVRAELNRSLALQAAYLAGSARSLGSQSPSGHRGHGCSPPLSPAGRASATSATWCSCAGS
jgi:lipopolysaccharide exporter